MARRSRRKSTKNKKQEQLFQVGQRVVVDGYGAGTVIDVETRRGFHYSDLWVRPDENPQQEIGVRYRHGVEAADDEG